MVAIIGFSIYSIVLPFIVFITLINVFVDAFNVRTKLINYERRTINQSEPILTRREQLYFIFFLGIAVNSWLTFNSFKVASKNLPGVISTLSSSSPPT